MNYSTRIALHDTDAAGVLFFGHLFRHLHDAYEDWMASLGFPLDTLLRAGEIALPLVHAEADYRAPLHHGDRLTIAVAVASLEPTRFAMTYTCVREDGRLAAEALTRHCCIDPQRRKPIPLPTAMATALRARLQDVSAPLTDSQ